MNKRTGIASCKLWPLKPGGTKTEYMFSDFDKLDESQIGRSEVRMLDFLYIFQQYFYVSSLLPLHAPSSVLINVYL